MSRQSTAYAYLAFWGDDFLLQEFSSLVGLQPTFSRKKGEVIRTRVLAKECLWQFECDGTDDCKGLNNSLEKLRTIFSEQADAIRQFMQAHHMEARCTVVLTLENGENPGVRLSPKFISFLAEIGAGFELDGYQ